MAKEFIVISATCCNKGCTRVSRFARRLSDFWVTECEQCSAGEITLDMDKISAAAAAIATRKAN